MDIDQEWINSLPVPSWLENRNRDQLIVEVDRALKTYDDRRKIAEEIFKRPGMEEAVIDELEAMGFQVIETS